MQGMDPRDRVHDRGQQALRRRKGRLHQGRQGRSAHLPLAGGVGDDRHRGGADEKHRKRIHKGGEVEFYQPILDQYEELLKKHPKFASITFCWMQGERDANGGADAAYKKSLQQLIANLRRDLKRPDMNIVIGRIGDYALDRPIMRRGAAGPTRNRR